ncbi:hypothetical protein L9F63_009638, partial [Diploptera punctata]
AEELRSSVCCYTHRSQTEQYFLRCLKNGQTVNSKQSAVFRSTQNKFQKSSLISSYGIDSICLYYFLT